MPKTLTLDELDELPDEQFDSFDAFRVIEIIGDLAEGKNIPYVRLHLFSKIEMHVISKYLQSNCYENDSERMVFFKNWRKCRET